MRILFTKKGIEENVRKNLAGNHLLFFHPMVTTSSYRYKLTHLTERFLLFSNSRALNLFLKKFRLNSQCRILTIGKEVKKKVDRLGLPIIFHADSEEELINWLSFEKIGKFRVTNIGYNNGYDSIQNACRSKAIRYRKITPFHDDYLCGDLAPMDVIVFFSPTIVQSFCVCNKFDNQILFSSDYETTTKIREYTNLPVYTSEENNLEEIISLMNSILNKK